MTTLLLATGATARPPTAAGPLTAADFHPIVLPPGSVRQSPPPAMTSAGRIRTGATIPDFADASRAVPSTRPTPVQRMAARAISKEPPFRSTGHRASGLATWYCLPGVSRCHNAYPGGLYAAAGPGLRVGDWRGRRVQVCGSGACVVVRLVDWCACGGGARLIDLYSDAFRRLAPLSSGGVRVTVRW